MYKVFVNNKIITFSKNLYNNWFESENTEIHQYINKKNLNLVVNEFLQNNLKTNLFVYSPMNLSKTFEAFSSDYKIIKASGGIVQKDDKYLFIYRNNNWDLPKGKQSKGENIKETAIREIEEETNINNLVLVKRLTDTYHIYTSENYRILKKCYWFHFKTYTNSNPLPQTEENITEVKWFKINEIDNIIDKTYPSIAYLLKKFFNNFKKKLKN